MRDITDVRKFSKISENNKMLTLLTSSVTHEMITPLRCIIQFTLNVLKSTTDPAKKKELELILSTSQLLLSQVKLLLDRNMLEKNIFVPNLEMHPFNATISNVVQLLQRQAELHKIIIAF
jgi:signal transduction histidine kinase